MNGQKNPDHDKQKREKNRSIIAFLRQLFCVVTRHTGKEQESYSNSFYIEFRLIHSFYIRLDVDESIHSVLGWMHSFVLYWIGLIRSLSELDWMDSFALRWIALIRSL